MLTQFRRHVWSRLPVRWRQGIVRKATELLAPPISRDAKPIPPIIVVGLFSQASGLGAAARACHDALAAGGLPVYGIDVAQQLRYEKNFRDFTYRDGRDVVGHGTLLLHVPGPRVPHALMHPGKNFVRDKHVIAHWFWELETLPQDWHAAVPFVHEVFVNTEFVAGAVRKLSDDLPVHVVAYPLSRREPMGRPPRSDREKFTVLFVFNVLSNFTRKNPCAVIAAFRQAFGDDPQARLIIKHTNSSRWPRSVELMKEASAGAENIELLGDTLDDAGMDELYERADVLLSLHRSEGLGLVMAEAMQRGIPVISTNWSGNAEFLNAESAVLIDCDLVPVSDPQGSYSSAGTVWASPDIDAAAAALRALRAEPDLRCRLGAAGALGAAEFFAPARYVDFVRRHTHAGLAG